MPIPRPLSRQPIPTSARRVFEGRLFEVYQWEQRQFDGSISVFEKVRRPDTAYVIPITANRKLLLVQQVQPGSAPSVGLIGGRIELGETPEEGANRELLEEVGLKTKNLILWDSYQFLPKVDWAIYVFFAHDCESVGHLRPDAGECINQIEVSFDEFLELVRDSSFGDVEVALQVLRMSVQAIGHIRGMLLR